ncbi:hypothetical protein [Legionella sp.]|uniref:hypothetical protein n=1 Tax=Legionella sp. TaxID=459 RepID=UPI003C8F392B
MIQTNISVPIGLPFQNYQLKLIVSPLESRLGLLGQQYFLKFRVEQTKLQFLKEFLANISRLNKNLDSIEIKLEITQCLLNRLRSNKIVYIEGGKTVLAIDKTQRFL